MNSGHAFEQTPGDTEGQGNLACCSPWDCKESDTTQKLNNISIIITSAPPQIIRDYIPEFGDPFLKGSY